MKSVALSIRPYARLLTMLGDQLIKNERIALVELIKNAYDADADRVEIRFEDFNKDMSHNEASRIVVRDDGTGMKFETVRTQWMNPAAPQKYLDKLDGSGKTPGKKRVIQGDKGIGRFAVLKLGRVVTITTRPDEADLETVLVYNFSRFDDEFVSENDKRKDIFLDEIKVECLQSEPTKLPGAEHGTMIEIQNLKGIWNETIIKQLCRDVSNLTDPVSRITRRKASNRFEIDIFCNGELRSVESDSTETLKIPDRRQAGAEHQRMLYFREERFPLRDRGQQGPNQLAGCENPRACGYGGGTSAKPVPSRQAGRNSDVGTSRSSSAYSTFRAASAVGMC